MRGNDKMNAFVEHLKTMNRKERYYLVKWATGFVLCDDFRRELGQAIGVRVPPDAFAAMDFHLNWIYAALVLTSLNDVTKKVHPNPDVVPGNNETGIVRGNQEDVDLVVAFEHHGQNHLVMVEAKGVTAWSPEQLGHKVRRLDTIFNAKYRRLVQPHLIAVSPHHLPPLTAQITKHWPDWVWAKGKAKERQLDWIRMPIDEPLFAVTRCDEDGKADAIGRFWTLKKGDAVGSSRSGNP
jgi:hypothetical protein